MNKYSSEMTKIQKQYADLINSFCFSETEDFYYTAISLIEKCERFWTTNGQKMSMILDDLASSRRCCVLEGAIYLGIKNKEHYPFFSLGEYHFLNDPFVKMRYLFVNGEKGTTEYCKRYFLNAYYDTVSILKDYSNYFHFFSLDVLCAHQLNDFLLLGEKVYWDSISAAVGKECRSIKDLEDSFRTLDGIERAIHPDVLKQFVFLDSNDINLSLKERVERFCQFGQSIVGVKEHSDIQKFYIATITFVQQAVSIVAKCLQFKIHPFIRSEIVFRYSALILKGLSNEITADYLLDAIVSYCISTFIIDKEADSIPFDEFASICLKERFSEKVFKEITITYVDSSAFHFDQIIDTLLKIYHSIFEKKQNANTVILTEHHNNY